MLSVAVRSPTALGLKSTFTWHEPRGGTTAPSQVLVVRSMLKSLGEGTMLRPSSGMKRSASPTLDTEKVAEVTAGVVMPSTDVSGRVTGDRAAISGVPRPVPRSDTRTSCSSVSGGSL